MSATIALLRIQLHFMKWPLVVLTTSTLTIYFLPKETDMVAALGNLAQISIPILVWLVGPVLFGSEYVEGAKDYIDTKPVSINQVFWIKMLILIPFVVCCAYLCEADIIFTVFFLNIALAGVAMTVLFKDMVRGILTGPIAVVLFGVLLLIPWYVLCGNHTNEPWKYTGGEYPWMVQLLIKLNEYFLPGIVLLSPLIYLWATRWMYQYSRTGSCCPPLDASMILLLPCLMYAGFANSCWWHEGSSSYIQSPILSWSQKQEPFRSCLARVLVDNQQRYLSLGEKEGEFVVHEVSDRLGESKPKELFRFTSSLARESVIQRKKEGVFLGWEPWIDEQNIVLFNNQSKDAVCIHYSTSGIIDANTISLDIQPINISRVNAEKMLIHGMNREASGTNQVRTKYRNLELDLVSGEVKPVSGEMNMIPGLYSRDDLVFRVVQTTSRCYRMWFDTDPNAPTLEWKERSSPADTPFTSPMLRVISPVVDDTLMAAKYMERVFSVTEPVTLPDANQISLCDTSARGDLNIVKVRIPFGMVEVYEKLHDVYSLFGMKGGEEALIIHPYDYNRITLGEGFLFYWAQFQGRVAVWDIHDLSNIRFIGISDCPAVECVRDHSYLFQTGMPHTCKPQVRSDGALGFIMNEYGPVWLEFPALMKEAKS